MAKSPKIRPRNPVARAPILRKGGAHQRRPEAADADLETELDEALETDRPPPRRPPRKPASG
ncbi:MAG: hypothetical protein KDG50_02200 [Chromatiales bacterium]|nr:hypothetical protein [Chromatiales bacterium]